MTEALLKRDRLIVAAGLVVITALAWAYLFTGAGTGMDLLDMSRLGLSPGLSDGNSMTTPDGQAMSGGETAMPGMAMEGMAATGMAPAWNAAYWAIMIVMWWVMMTAMMVPSAAPTILLYARTTRHAQKKGRMAPGAVPTAVFAGGYLAAWLGFSVAATALQFALEQAGLVSSMMMWSLDPWLSAGVLVAAGLYQLTPLKTACLKHCRSPVEFLSRHWRLGPAGGFAMGVHHGAFCVGCCWGLMALLFVGGIMNLLWIAGLAIVVLVEKLLPRGQVVARIGGVACLLAAGWIAAEAGGLV